MNEPLDYLETQEGVALVSDDAGRWAVAGSGFQNVPSRQEPIDITTTFFIEADEWKPSIREAIETYRQAEEGTTK